MFSLDRFTHSTISGFLASVADIGEAVNSLLIWIEYLV